jgi:hypothetical protein
MKRSQGLAFFVLLYIGLDFCDPSVPGVFFFDSSHLFMDGVVEVKALDSTGMSPTPSETAAAAGVVTPSPAPRIVLAVAVAEKLRNWRPTKRDCLLSSAAQSPEDH